MRATAKILLNYAEIQESERLGMNQPEEELADVDFYFNGKAVDFFYKDITGYITIMIGYELHCLEYKDKLWNYLIDCLIVK